MMRHDALAEGDEFVVTHVVLGIIGAPRADDETPCAVRFEYMIDGGEERKVGFLGKTAQFLATLTRLIA